MPSGRRVAVAAALLAVACGRSSPPAPSPAPADATAATTDATAVVAPDSEAAYAQLLIAAIVRCGGPPALRFDADRHAITDGELRIATPDLYAEYLALPPAGRARHLEDAARAFATDRDGPPLREARAQLRPVVRAGVYFDAALTDDAPPGSPPVALPRRPLGEVTGVGLAFDLPTSMQLVTAGDLVLLGLSFDDALALAIQHLDATPAPFVELRPGVWTAAANDGYATSRLLLVDPIRRLPLRGAPVALIPNRDTLLIAGDRDVAALRAIADLATDAAAAPRAIHTVPLCLRGAAWIDCAPAPSPAVARQLRGLATIGRVDVYEAQRPRLQAQLGGDVYVGEASVARHQATGAPLSYATWAFGEPTLIPHVDHVGLVAAATATQPGASLGFVPWERLQRVLASRLARDDRSPPRWATGTYVPTAAELAALAPTADLPPP
ncbi:MAG: hypothetical protein JNK64_14275 [Myxococcales bacterium]|nr:hypothetical protein [Myxococcales bacterium]